jgi:hypothetical protein
MLSKQKTLVARKALQTRLSFGYPLDSPCDVYELVSREGLGLKFSNTSTLAGMFLNDGVSGEIVVSALRPSGYQRFTAAHELGHFVFGHGARVDGEIEAKTGDSEEEAIADAFARHVLMPQRAVAKGLAMVGANSANCSSTQAFSVASWLGVGYTTLIQQMRWTLSMITSLQFHELNSKQPQQIKRNLVPTVQWSGRRELWPLAPWWQGTRVHLQIGDVVTGLPTMSSPLFDFCDGYAIAKSCGQTQVDLGGANVVHLSIARADFVGLYKFRYLEEPVDA